MHFAVFSNPLHFALRTTQLFSTPSKHFSTYPILPGTERAHYSAVACILPGYHNNRPIPAHTPIRQAKHSSSTPGPPYSLPPGPPPGPPRHSRPHQARNHHPRPYLARPNISSGRSVAAAAPGWPDDAAPSLQAPAHVCARVRILLLILTFTSLNSSFFTNTAPFFSIHSSIIYTTFPIENVENVKLRQTVTPGCLFVSDEKFTEQL